MTGDALQGVGAAVPTMQTGVATPYRNTESDPEAGDPSSHPKPVPVCGLRRVKNESLNRCLHRDSGVQDVDDDTTQRRV